MALSDASPDRMRQKENRASDLLLAPFSFLTLPSFRATILQSQALIGVVIMALVASTGDILLATGVKQVGEVFAMRLRSLLALIRRVLTNPLIGLGVACMSADFFLFIARQAGLSLIMPLTALSYPFSILGSHYVLKERLTVGRLAGTGLIGVGVAFISLTATTQT